MDWYYYNDFNEKIGPFSAATLTELVKSGIVRRDTVIENTDGRSVSAGEVQGFVFPVPSPVVSDTLLELCENSEEESVFRIFMRDNIWGLRKAWSVIYPVLYVLAAILYVLCLVSVKVIIAICTFFYRTFIEQPEIPSRSNYLYSQQTSYPATNKPAPARSSPHLSSEEVSALDELEFEKYVAKLYEAKGYRTTLTKRSGDGGVDIHAENDTERVIIQCKHRSDPKKAVPVSDVRELAGVFLSSREEKRLTKAILVTNGRFSDGTRKDPTAKSIELIDGKRLRKL